MLGKRLVEFFVPVLPCHAPDALGRVFNANHAKNGSSQSHASPTLSSTNAHYATNTKRIGTEDMPMTSGAFLEANTHLSVKIASAKPLLNSHNPYESPSAAAGAAFKPKIVSILTTVITCSSCSSWHPTLVRVCSAYSVAR